MSKTLKSSCIAEIIATFAISVTVTSYAQEPWHITSSTNGMVGKYAESQTINEQHGFGIRIVGEKDQQWGFTAGWQTTLLDLKPISQTPNQSQNNWLMSSFLHAPTTAQPGRLTLQLDTHAIKNTATESNSSNVYVIAPKISWVSQIIPLKLDFSYAKSQYKNSPQIQQASSSISYGFNMARDWFQIRTYDIKNIAPQNALGLSNTRANDYLFTHIFHKKISYLPSTLTIGIEHGQKIYAVDMSSQTVYNLPMLNQGGKNISASWIINNEIELMLQYSKVKYLSELPFNHSFTLGTSSLQIVKVW